MIDDKTIEAMAKALYDHHESFVVGIEPKPWDDLAEYYQEQWRKYARAALAAVDKVRAEKDKRFINERAENVSLKVGIEDLMAENERLRAGLAKGDAERAVLVEALEIIAGERQCLDNLMGNRDVAHAALALVRKGV